MHIGRRPAVAGLAGVLVVLPASAPAAGHVPVAAAAGVEAASLPALARAPAQAPSAARSAASVRATVTVLPSGRLRVVVRTDASRVSARYVVSGRSTRTLSIPVRAGRARVTLPRSATSVRVRAAAGSGRPASAWQRLVVAPRSPLDASPTPEQLAAMQDQMLVLVNEVRAAGVTCPGGVVMAPAPPLVRNPAIDAAAAAQAGWQAGTGILSHTGAGGSSVGRRITASGYTWTRVAEVVSAGYQQPADVLHQWLGSSGHCRALMDPDITDTGIAYAYSPTSLLRHFWTQDLART